ncbi:MAG TPA: carboxypeptidase-like regulatory domain-containing protein, partial [Pseudomonadales bacterium]|nr:carboxypeptidase-like regulatory domain-containing protein [Pseudomonadales bacterium]
KSVGFILAFYVVAMITPISASAYEVVAVENGGTVTGTVLVKGPVPELRRFKVEKTPEVCGEDDRLLAEIRARDGKLADVVVLIKQLDAGKPYPLEEVQGGPPEEAFHLQVEGGGSEYPGTTIKPKKCIFGPYTGVIAQEKMLRFRNQDPVKHSPHTYSSKGRVKKTLHNEDLPGDGSLDLMVKMEKAKVVKLECDQHEHMQNWFRTVDNPYYAFSGEDGTFSIDQIPPGTYTLIAWHPKFKREQKQEITVAANGTVSNIDFTFKVRVRKTE